MFQGFMANNRSVRDLPDLSVQINLHAVAALVGFSLMQT